MTIELLNKFLNNKCSEAELQQVLAWLKTDALTEESRRIVFEDWNSYKAEDVTDDGKFMTLFDGICEKINTAENRKNRSLVFMKWLTRVAAILLLPVLAVLFYYMSFQNKLIWEQGLMSSVDSLEIIAPIGSRAVVQLSDGSVVHLNYGSKIKYPQKFIGNTREVILSGEGYFDIAHNPQKPFIVKAFGVNVKALGTVFNVMAYPDDNEVNTTLVKGKVVLESETPNGEIKTICNMLVNQHVKYNINTNKVLITKEDPEKYIAWKDGILVFEDTPIEEVAEKLGRMFNVDIIVADNAKDFIYSVTFIDEPLYQILDLMAIATPLKYKICKRKKLSNGSYSKQVIKIERRN